MKKTPKQYSSVELELELDRRVPKISRKYPNDEAMFDAARKAGMNIGKYDTWHICATFIAVQELKREIPKEHHPAWFRRY